MVGIAALFVAVSLTAGLNGDAVPFTSEGIDMRLLLGSQAAIVVLTLAVARLMGPTTTDQLRLGPPDGGPRAYLYAVLLMLPVLATINGLIWTVWPDDALRDFLIFRDLARSPYPLVPALAVSLGAPLSEELLFRGFLLAPLASTRLGFWAAAMLVALVWTLLHWGYSAVGLAEVLAIGIYLSWTLYRTGSLRVALFCHALYNSVLFILLRYMPA